MAFAAKWLVGMVRGTMAAAQRMGQVLGTPTTALILSETPLSADERADVLARMRFYAPWMVDGADFITHCSVAQILSTRPILLRNTDSTAHKMLRWIRKTCFDIDPATNPNDGWDWCRVNFEATCEGIPKDSRQRFTRYLDQLQQLNLSKCYLFGTGPSLAHAASRDWSDGYRIVCNTIVRDAELWHHIQPHFIAAADAIYHFGFTAFARQFRADLRDRLRETSTYFIYPETFHGLVADEFAAVADRLIPIPQGRHANIQTSLREQFALPNLGNVLNLILLPLGCTLSKHIWLWGFDGRAPNDELFWANSSKHSYPDLMSSLRNAHPAFFAHHVPTEKPTKYVNTFHGDRMDECLSSAEQDGWEFVMMHKSWTPTLQKRFRDQPVSSATMRCSVG